MFKNLKSFAVSGKDSVVAMAVKGIVNHKLAQKKEANGTKLEALDIDSVKKNITVTLTLPELSEPLTIEVRNYRITADKKNHFLEVEELIKSQEWGNHYIDGKRYKIPSEVVKVAEAIL